jgi:excisionase family DNA binding protein
MTVREAARRLEVSVRQVYKLVSMHAIRHYRLGTGAGGPIRISEEALEEYLRRREVGPDTADEEEPLRHLP